VSRSRYSSPNVQGDPNSQLSLIQRRGLLPSCCVTSWGVLTTIKLSSARQRAKCCGDYEPSIIYITKFPTPPMIRTARYTIPKIVKILPSMRPMRMLSSLE